MHMNRRSCLSLSLTIAVVVASKSAAGVGADTYIYLDGGLGGSRAQPFVTGTALCGTVRLGASSPLRGVARVCGEFRASFGGDFPTGNPEDANAGRQSIVTLVAGRELLNPKTVAGVFLMSGMGVGHSTISGARGPTDSPNFGLVPLMDRTSAAYAVGLGYRFSGGPWSTHAHLALRLHGLFRQGISSSSYATALTVGVTR